MSPFNYIYISLLFIYCFLLGPRSGPSELACLFSPAPRLPSALPVCPGMHPSSRTKLASLSGCLSLARLHACMALICPLDQLPSQRHPHARPPHVDQLQLLGLPQAPCFSRHVAHAQTASPSSCMALHCCCQVRTNVRAVAANYRTQPNQHRSPSQQL